MLSDKSELATNTENNWIIFELNHDFYGIPALHVLQMIVLPDVFTLAGSPPEARGVINLRGDIIPVFDVRSRLGMPSVTREIEETASLLEQRKQDHINWLDRLSEAVRENHPFTLTTDPHKCAFGKWYDNYTTDNISLSMQLLKFNAPHITIHGIAEKADALIQAGRTEEAEQLIEKTRDKELAHMIRLFDETKEILLREIKETCIIVEHESAKFGLIVDDVSESRHIDASSIEIDAIATLPGGENLYNGVAEVNERMVPLLNIAGLIGDA